jgi:hypothetical protein
LVPQLVPAAVIFWFVQVGVPLPQAKVPGSQADPQAAPIMHATQLPLPSQTWPLPQEVPAVALFCTQTCFPVLQS